MQRGLAILGGLFLTALAVSQFVRPGHRNGRINESETIEARTHMPPEIAGILHRACQDCHSEQTVWPWYSNISPVLWLTVADVNAGRSHMDLSRWGRLQVAEQIDRLKGICEMVQKGEMPLWYYRPLHPAASLSGNDVTQLCAWTESQRAQLSGGVSGK